MTSAVSASLKTAREEPAVDVIIDSVRSIADSDALQPEVRLIGAQALLDELARALARMAINLQPEDIPDPSEPDR